MACQLLAFRQATSPSELRPFLLAIHRRARVGKALCGHHHTTSVVLLQRSPSASAVTHMVIQELREALSTPTPSRSMVRAVKLLLLICMGRRQCPWHHGLLQTFRKGCTTCKGCITCNTKRTRVTRAYPLHTEPKPRRSAFLYPACQGVRLSEPPLHRTQLRHSFRRGVVCPEVLNPAVQLKMIPRLSILIVTTRSHALIHPRLVPAEAVLVQHHNV